MFDDTPDPNVVIDFDLLASHLGNDIPPGDRILMLVGASLAFNKLRASLAGFEDQLSLLCLRVLSAVAFEQAAGLKEDVE